jgi:hypothetical protein
MVRGGSKVHLSMSEKLIDIFLSCDFFGERNKHDHLRKVTHYYKYRFMPTNCHKETTNKIHGYGLLGFHRDEKI